MDILIIGSGGREHALALALKKSPKVEKIYCAPGNAGIAALAGCVPIGASDIESVVGFARKENIGLVVVAPDDPLALGMVDALEAAGVRAFGPRRKAAQIESSKAFAKNLMKKYNIPTADYEVFTKLDDAISYIRFKGAPIVIKADGLALGKGVIVAHTLAEAEEAARSMLRDGKFGTAGSAIVVEEYMTGSELSVLCFTDGKSISAMPAAQDHKRIYDGDRGPNTGGMGAFCPSPNYTPETEHICMQSIILPTISAMRSEGREFKGVLYFGLMLTAKGPRVVEYNARFGDPETQAILSLLDTDLLEILEAVIDGRLSDISIKWKSGAACCIVMSSAGYPGTYKTGYEISGLDLSAEGVFIFHSGTSVAENGHILTNGGRVLGVTATGNELVDAIAKAYSAVRRISFEGAYYRSDIGQK